MASMASLAPLVLLCLWLQQNFTWAASAMLCAFLAVFRAMLKCLHASLGAP